MQNNNASFIFSISLYFSLSAYLSICLSLFYYLFDSLLYYLNPSPSLPVLSQPLCMCLSNKLSVHPSIFLSRSVPHFFCYISFFLSMIHISICFLSLPVDHSHSLFFYLRPTFFLFLHSLFFYSPHSPLLSLLNSLRFILSQRLLPAQSLR